jgi:hypothetical protein
MSNRKLQKKKVWSYHRIKTNPGDILTATYHTESGDCCKTWPSNFSLTYVTEGYDGNHEYIDYYIRSKPYVTPQPCLHIKNRVIPEPIPSTTVFQSVATHRCSNGSYQVHKQIDTISPRWYSLLPAGNRLPTIPDLSQAHREALAFFASGCQPLVANWAVNVFEISEILELATQALKAARLFLKLAREQVPYAWGMFLRRFSTLNTVDKTTYLAKVGSKELADAYLQYSFAIAPLLSDVKAMQDELNGLVSRVAFFRKNNKKPVHVRFKKDLSTTCTTQSVTFPSIPVTSSLSGSQIFTTQYKATYVASAMATYDVSALKDSDIAYKLAKKAYGFSDPLVFLWEITRFSFIVDWIIDVGGYLASLPSIPTFPYVLSNPVHSIKVEQTNVYTIYNYTSSAYTPRAVRQHVTFTDVIEYYKRTLGIPLLFSGIDTSLPGFEQLKLALSLGRGIFK